MFGVDAATLRVLVQAQGISDVNRQLAGVDRGLMGVAKTAEKSQGRMSKALGAVGRAAKVGLIGVGGASVVAGAKMISLASDAEEMAAKFKVVFGPAADRATKSLDAFSRATGTSKFALREQAAGFQALIRPMGLSTDRAAGMSVGMTKLATDLASFNNTSVKEAITALQSGLVGESEPLRRYGVQLSAARIEAFAYARGIAKVGSELTPAQKAQASYGLILKDTKLAQGDATRTAGSFANQFKTLKARVTDIATEIGVVLLPVALKLVSGMTGLIDGFRKGTGAGGTLRDVISNVGAAFKTVAGVIGDVVGWFIEHKTVTLALGAALGVVLTALAGFKIVAAVQAAIIGLRVAMIGLNIALAANPIGIVVVALAALAAALVVAYRKSETFRAIVDGAFKAVLNTIRTVLATIKTVLVNTWEFLRTATSTAWQGIKDAIITPVRTARDVLGDVWDAVRDRAAGMWRGLRETASIVWDNVKDAILTPIRAARDIAGDVWDAMKERASNAFDRMVGFAKDFGGAVKGAVVSAFKGVVNTVIGFINKILDVIEEIPGVPNFEPIAKLATGGTMSSRGVDTEAVEMLARGGKITRPMAIVGEEAPRHAEYVIPTNPAYRSRALGLYGKLGSDLGVPAFAVGGVLGGIGGALGNAVSGVGGAVADLGGSLSSKVGQTAVDVIGMLPGVGDLPGWLSGTAKYVLDKATGYIRDQFKKIDAARASSGGGSTNGLVPQVLRAINFARLHGWSGAVVSGFRSYAEQAALYAKYLNGTGNLAARPGTSNHEGGQAIDVSDTEGFARAMALMGAGALRRGIPSEPWHFSVTGYRQGGILGSYAQGTNYVPQTGPYMLHQGEKVTPAGQRGGGDVHVHGDLVVREEADIHRVAGQFAWLTETAA